MAAEDYNVADRRNADGTLATDGTATPLEAAEKVAETVQGSPDAQSQSYADAAGVRYAAFVGYADALDAHASRADIEGLRERRLREYGDEFADGDFMRQAASDEPPTPGSVNGVAPDATGYTDGTPLSTAAGAPVDTDEDGIYEGTGESPDPTP